MCNVYWALSRRLSRSRNSSTWRHVNLAIFPLPDVSMATSRDRVMSKEVLNLVRTSLQRQEIVMMVSMPTRTGSGLWCLSRQPLHLQASGVDWEWPIRGVFTSFPLFYLRHLDKKHGMYKKFDEVSVGTPLVYRMPFTALRCMVENDQG